MTRHIGAFIQNTIKPLIEELDELLGKCKHLNMDKEERRKILDAFIALEIYKVGMYSMTYLILGTLFCMTVYFILH